MSLSDEKEMYLLMSELPEFKCRIEKARRCLENALKISRHAAVSFSAGKDSVVLLHLAVEAGFKGKLVFFKYGIFSDVETPAENIELLKYYADLYHLDYAILDCLGEVDCWEQCGRFTLFPETEEEKRIFRRTNYDYVKKSAQFEEESRIDLSIIGMRKDESKRRRMVLNKTGAVYQTKSRNSVTACPLLNLTNNDIWAYIVSRNLKYLSIYDYPYIDRRVNRNEITLLYNDAIFRNGMLFHYRKMYPDYFFRIKSRWGDVLP